MRRWRVSDLLLKAALVVLLLSALLFPDLAGTKGKAAGARLVVYPLGMLAVPLWWWIYGQRRAVKHRAEARFPWAADVLVTLPWFLDTLGNRLDLFDTVSWFDDAMHFVNWLLLTAGVLVAWSPRRTVSRSLVVMTGLGFGVTAAVLWELGEYAAFLRGSPELLTAYTDTLGDVSLGAAGAFVGGTLVALRHPAAENRE